MSVLIEQPENMRAVTRARVREIRCFIGVRPMGRSERNCAGVGVWIQTWIQVCSAVLRPATEPLGSLASKRAQAHGTPRRPEAGAKMLNRSGKSLGVLYNSPVIDYSGESLPRTA